MSQSKNAVWSIADQGVLSASRFFITYLIGRYALPGELGIYSLGFSLLIFLTTFQESLITTPFQFFSPQTEESERKSLAGNLFLSAALMAGMGSVALLLTLWVVSRLGLKWDLAPALLALAFCLPFHLFREFARRWQFVHGKIVSIALMDGVFALIQVCGLLLLLWCDRLNANYAFALTGLASLVFCSLAYMRYRKQIAFERERWRSDVDRNLRYGRWIALSSLCAVAQTYFANWYLATKLSLHDADIYTVCSTMALLANPFLLGISSMHGPQASAAFVESGVRGVVKTVFRNLLLVCVILGLYAAALGLFGDWLATTLFGPPYAGQQWPILVLSLAILGQGVNYIIANGLCAVNFPHLDLLAALIGLTASAAVSLTLEPSVLNASIGFLSGVIAMAVFRFGMLQWIATRSRRPMIERH